jgi:plastocyanin
LVMAAPAGAADQTVTATSSNVFSPANVTIDPGDTVTFRNGGGPHNVIFEDGVRYPDVGNSSAPWEFPRTFTAQGSYRYYCSVHGALGSGMSGQVTVNPPPPGGNPPPGGTPPPGGGNPPPTGGNPPGGGSGGGGGGSQPGSPSPGAPGAGKSSSAVTLKVSDATPARGQRVRFFGTVRPAQDGRRVQLQRRTGGGSYRTVARIKLTDAGASRSKFSKRLRMLKDAVFRARLPADKAHAASTSRRKRVNVH